MAHKQKQCEAKHPIHKTKCWLRQHGPEERHMTVIGSDQRGPIRAYWSAS